VIGVRSTLRALPGRLEKLGYETGLRSAAGLALPGFLGIGAQKAGTTWLHENLRCHPELFLPEQKELHYFDWSFHRPLHEYAARFEPGAGRLCGEITPGYSILEPARIRFVRRLLPELRLILLLRDPIQRAWSQALMNLVTRPGRRFAELPEEEFIRHFESPRSMARGDYATILERWSDAFPSEQLFVGFFEEIAERPRELLERILGFLGVSRHIDFAALPLHRVTNPGADLELPPRLHAVLCEIYAADLRRLALRFGAPVERWQRAHGLV
jgi:hypothetical protein